MATVGIPPRPHTASKDRGDHTYDGADEDSIIAKLVSGEDLGAEAVEGSFSFGDTVGKLDDAVDYEDISDDDLPSDEDVLPKPSTAGGSAEDMDTAGGDDDDLMAGEDGADGNMDLDDLFGDMGGELMSDPTDADLGGLDGFGLAAGSDALASGAGSGGPFGADIGYHISSMAGAVPPPPPPPQDPVELARQYFPDFEPHAVLSFSTLFKAKPGTLQTGPQKVPRVCVPTKIHVEMAPDENVLFNKASSAAHRGTASREKGVVAIPPPVEDDDGDDEKPEEAATDADLAFVRDLEIACCDWDSKIDAAMVATPPPSPPRGGVDGDEIEIGRPPKVCVYASFLFLFFSSLFSSLFPFFSPGPAAKKQ